MRLEGGEKKNLDGTGRKNLRLIGSLAWVNRSLIPAARRVMRAGLRRGSFKKIKIQRNTTSSLIDGRWKASSNKLRVVSIARP